MAKNTSASAPFGLAALELPDMKPAQLTVFNEIGQGRFKTVSSGRHNRHGLCAIYRYKPDGNRNEARVLSMLSKSDNTCIPEIYGAYMERSGLVLAQEFSTFGSMRSVLQDPDLASMVTPGHKHHVAVQLADAVAFLASMHIVHSDLACRNILVFQLDEDPKNVKVKLTDFTNAIMLPTNATHVVRKMPQATRWCAPETIAANKWSYKTDVWSLGAALWELFAGGLVPWTGYSKRSDVALKLRELAESVDTDAASKDLCDDFPAPDYGTCPSHAYAALLSCLRADASERPSAKQLMSVLKQALDKQDTSTPASISQANVEVTPRLSQEPQQMMPSAPVVIRRPCAGQDVNQSVASAKGAISHVIESTPTPAKSGGYVLTPPTRCPSTPEYASRKSSLCPDYVLVGGEMQPLNRQSRPLNSRQTLPSVSSQQFSQELTRKIASLESVKTLLSSPEQQPENLENLKAFLSSREAICGLDAESLISLRRKIAAAQERESVRSYPMRIHGPVSDVILPLKPLAESWNISHGVLLQEPVGRLRSVYSQ